jgi:hypothetical protein
MIPYLFSDFFHHKHITNTFHCDRTHHWEYESTSTKHKENCQVQNTRNESKQQFEGNENLQSLKSGNEAW